jgi:hypothetical protein
MSTRFDSEGVAAGYSVYTSLTLHLYDAYVIGFCNRFIWRCESGELLALYQRNVSACHLDVGVGTGYFLDRTQFPAVRPVITLLDANPACLATASRRIARHVPCLVAANVLDPLPPMGPFSSVGLCYLLHCVPGGIPAKAIMFDHFKAVMAPAARIFGATIVQGSAPRSWLAQRLLNFYNAKGFFSNAHDTVEDLEAELASRFCDVKVTMQGSVALFEAQRADEPDVSDVEANG